MGRLPVGFIATGGALETFATVDLFIVACLLHDLVARRGRVHPALLVGGAFLVVTQVGRMWFCATDAWKTIARFLVS